MVGGVIAWAGYPQNLWISLGTKRVFRSRDSGMAAGEKSGKWQKFCHQATVIFPSTGWLPCA